jgi:hypothetical protein
MFPQTLHMVLTGSSSLHHPQFVKSLKKMYTQVSLIGIRLRIPHIMGQRIRFDSVGNKLRQWKRPVSQRPILLRHPTQLLQEVRLSISTLSWQPIHPLASHLRQTRSKSLIARSIPTATTSRHQTTPHSLRMRINGLFMSRRTTGWQIKVSVLTRRRKKRGLA